MAFEDRVYPGHGEAQNRSAGDDKLQDSVHLVDDSREILSSTGKDDDLGRRFPGSVYLRVCSSEEVARQRVGRFERLIRLRPRERKRVLAVHRVS
jgi:hypothetical protein